MIQKIVGFAILAVILFTLYLMDSETGEFAGPVGAWQSAARLILYVVVGVGFIGFLLFLPFAIVMDAKKYIRRWIERVVSERVDEELKKHEPKQEMPRASSYQKKRD
jgi:hypothetical protein